MGIEIKWLIKDQLCLVSFSGALTAEDFQTYDQEITAHLETAPDKLHFIADLHSITSLPPITSMIKLNHLHHPHLGRGLTVGLTHNPLGRFLISMGAQMVGVKQKDFNTIEEARVYLTQMEGL